MRKLKFRAWNRIVNRMSEVFTFETIPKNVQWQNLEILQFTGLTDKNEVEIYEGDIYKTISTYKPIGNIEPFEREVLFCIVFEEASFCAKVIKAKNKVENYNGIGTCKTDDIYHLHRTKAIEVIGNIYENKNLIK